jgi:parallel beta-helix repeat protein
MRLSTFLWRAAVAVAASLVLAPGALATKPVAVSCGQVITRDTKLANDLSDCHGIGLVVGADGVTLDLNGHTVDGDGVADFEGIQVKNHDRAIVKNGRITDFVEGVGVLFSTGTRIRDLSIARERHVAVFVGDSDDVIAERNAAADVAFAGLFATRSHDVRFQRNSVTTSGAGIAVRVSDHVAIAANTLSQNADGPGVFLFDGTSDSRVEHNTLVDNGDGIVLDGGPVRNVIASNSESGSGAGAVLVAAEANRIEGNLFAGNIFVGVVLVGSDDNRVESNSIVDSGHDPESEGGIHLVSNDDGSTSDRNLIVKNTLTGNAPDGLLVDAGQADTRVDSNRSDRNADDGIDVGSPATTLTGNTANRNHDLGIEAVAGVTDGGGNRARGNGNPLQCVDVFCKTG